MKYVIPVFVMILAIPSHSLAQATLTTEQEEAAADLAERLGAAMTKGVASVDGDSSAAMGASLVRKIGGRQREVFELAWPMLVGGAQQGLCKKTNWQTGILVASLDMSGKSGAGLVDHVASGSPAASAGIRTDDQIIRINDRTLRDSEAAAKRLDAASDSSAPLMIQIRRDGQLLDMPIQPVQACAYKVALMDAVGGALATGSTGQIQIDARAWSEARNDFEKQIVIAHELGHHAEGHVATRSRLAKGGRMLDTVGGYVGLPTQGVGGLLGSVLTKGGDETEADAASMQFLATVGITPEETVEFWSQVNSVQGHTFNTFTTQHPISDKRIAKLRESAARLDPKFIALSRQISSVKDAQQEADAVDDEELTDSSLPTTEH